MTAIAKPKLTAAEYLAIEETAEFKSEFVNGEIFAMAGVSLSHNDIKEKLIGELYAQLKGGSCRSFSSDQRVSISATGMYAYPDIVIVCGPVQTDPNSPSTSTNPTAVIEVLSPSTENYERGLKFRQYQQSPTLREYILVFQDEPRIEHFVRQPDDRWMLANIVGLSSMLAIESVPVRISLADVYRNVEFPPAGGPR